MMNSVNKTLYIPLFGKAFVSRKGILLQDAKAEEIWAAEGFPLKGKSKSKWLAYYMVMRSVVFDRWLEKQMAASPDAVILHIGCGMDSRALRVGTRGHPWFDIDFPAVITERKRYFSEIGTYRMIPSDIRDPKWLSFLPEGRQAVIVMEGVSMYLRSEELTAFLKMLHSHFSQSRILMDCYTDFSAKASKYKNPINGVGVTHVYGLDDPKLLEYSTGFSFVKEHDMTPDALIDQLQGTEKAIFKTLFAGKMANSMYRLYEYRK